MKYINVSVSVTDDSSRTGYLGQPYAPGTGTTRRFELQTADTETAREFLRELLDGEHLEDVDL